MNYDFSRALKDEFGKQLYDGGAPATVGTAFRKALIADTQNSDGRLTGVEKLKRFELWRKLTSTPADGPLELSLDDAARLEDSSSCFGTLIYAQLVLFLEGRSWEP